MKPALYSTWVSLFFYDDVGRMKRSASGDNAGNGSNAGSASLDPATMLAMAAMPDPLRLIRPTKYICQTVFLLDKEI